MGYVFLRDAINRRLGKVNRLRPVFEFLQGMDFGLRYIRHEVLPAPARASTREVYVEWVNYCNLRCAFCALDHEVVKERMSPRVWKKLLEELTTDARFESVEVVHLHNGGETLLHPQVQEFLDILDAVWEEARSRGRKPPRVELLTNGLVLTKAKRTALLNCRALTSIGISMDGGDPETYERMRIRAKWETFAPQVKDLLINNRLLDQPKETFIISVLPNRELLRSRDFHPEFREILNLAHSYELRLAHDWGGQVELEGVETAKRSKPWKWGCNMMMDQLVVFPNGDVSICCNDLNGKGTVGNLLADGLYGAYASPRRKEWLREMARNNTAAIPLCQGCERF